MRTPSALSRIISGEFPLTPPLITLLCINSTIIIFAVAGTWEAATVIFIYWVQSVIIGVFTVVSLLGADTAVLASDMGISLEEKSGLGILVTYFARFYKFLITGFFALHYGLFHVGYFSIIVDTGLFGSVNFSSPLVWASCWLFFANHLYSFFYYRRDTRKGGDYVTEEFIRSYSRIFPMHLTIIAGAIIIVVLSGAGIESTMPVLVLFLVLKVYADISMHIRKHLPKKETFADGET